MSRSLALLRHGLAGGQAPTAALLPEGAAYLRRLAAVLIADGWAPKRVICSPYLRARDSAEIMRQALAPHVLVEMIDELTPESEPDEALRALADIAPLDTPVLVVSHLPLIGRIAQELIGDDPGFSPGTFVEIVRAAGGPAQLLRRVGPQDIGHR
jgi:phosphohistidine phosphatase